MYQKCIIYITQLILVISIIVLLYVETTESSEDYLRKVIMELKGLKTPHEYSSTIYRGINFPANKRLSSSNSNFLPTPNYHKNIPRQQDILNTAASENQQYYQQIPAPIVIPETSKIMGEPVGFTKNQLASLYRHALESGSTVSLSTLKTALDSGHYHPVITGNHLQIPTHQQQLYKYHFYPLRSFADSIENNHGYKTINELVSQPIDFYPGTNKQIIINPLFMAVSSLMIMALLFMGTVIFLPRLLGEFKSRVIHDEFLNLTKTVTEAIDDYESTTTRPKTRFSGSVVGIKTRPVLGVGGASKRRRKIQRVGGKLM